MILAVGAIGSPYLLLRSGIGPAGALRALGIDPVADLPRVGENLQDHPTAKVCCATTAPPPASRYNYGETYAALRSHLAGEVPNLHLFPILLPLAPGAGLQLVRRVAAQASFGGAIELYLAPRSAPTRGCAITSAARSTATTTRSAPAGWAQTTTPSWTPTSASRGVAGLRVADASIMPLIPNAHPHATILAIAERAAARGGRFWV